MSVLGGQINLVIKDLQDGDLSARKRLFEMSIQHLKFVAYRYAHHKEDWQDILDDAYLKAFKYIHSADLSQDGYNWLCKIVQNVANEYRKMDEYLFVREETLFGDLEDEFIMSDALRRAILQLPQPDRKLIYLRFWGNRTFRQIADIVHKKKSTVFKRYVICLKILKEILLKE